jgi:hypothetical protein
VATTASEWLNRYAAALGMDPPTDDEQAALLAIAATAAHASDRLAAPISCWLAAKSGQPATAGLAAAEALAGELGADA